MGQKWWKKAKTEKAKYFLLAKSTSIGAECSKKREETLVNWKKKIKFSFSKAEYFLLAKSTSIAIGAECSEKKGGNFREAE